MRSPSITIIFFLLAMACKDAPEQIKPEIRTLTESVYASVSVVPVGLYNGYSSSPGILDDIYIEAGDEVTRGQLLANISAPNSRIRVDDARINLELAESKISGSANSLKLLADDIIAAEQQMTLDSAQYYRQKMLWEKAIGSLVDLETKELKYQLSKNKLQQLRTRYLKDKLELDLLYEKSQNELKKAKTDFSDFQIRSRMNGKVYQLFKEPGEFIGLQEPFIQIGHADSFLLELVVDELDIAKIKVGQTVFISLDAFQDELFEAKVYRIMPLKDDRTQTYTVEAKFETPPDVLYAGLAGEANILLGRRHQVITIPIDYLIDNSRVKTKNGDVEVELGVRNFSHVEVLSGIDTSTVILKPL